MVDEVVHEARDEADGPDRLRVAEARGTEDADDAHGGAGPSVWRQHEGDVRHLLGVVLATDEHAELPGPGDVLHELAQVLAVLEGGEDPAQLLRRSFGPLKKIEEYGLLDLIIPEIKPMRRIRQGLHHHLDVWNHSLETFKHLEAILNKAKDANTMSSYIAEEVSAGRSRYELIKLAGLLHDIGKPGTLSVKRGKVSFHGHERLGACMCEKIGIRLKLSNEEIRCLKQIVFSHLRPGFLADAPLLTRRARFRFFRDTGSEALSVLLVSLADQRATKGRLATRESRQRHERLIKRLMREYFTGRNEKKAKRLVNGNDLMDRFGLKPSPAIGKVLRELEELQAIGRIKNRREALRHAAKILKKS